MSSDIVIRAENLGKKYVIGHQSTDRATTFREVIARNTHNLARTARDLIHGKPLISGDEVEEFWALKDLNFEIHRGDVVGIIGRNGAGKSTLLKVLSRITEPSEGRVEIRGRVASLLEVGTGFHPELTGRENIFLNGAILGMNRSEIRRKFDEIVEFAEIEKFLDTPVKRYSSGMYVRLAFAVAAHLEPEILIVDEVLAVGDAEFQKKCLGKMQDVAGQGRTILFVSHNLDTIANLCSSGIMLQHGAVHTKGHIGKCLQAYLTTYAQDTEKTIQNCRDIKYRQSSELTSMHFQPTRPGSPQNIDSNVIILELEFRNDRKREVAIVIEDDNHRPIFTSHLSDSRDFNQKSGPQTFEIKLPDGFLKSGRYNLTLTSFDPERSHFYDVVNHLPLGEIVDDRFDGKMSLRPGRIHIPLIWQTRDKLKNPNLT